MQIGSEELEPVSGNKLVYCKRISLNSSTLHEFSQVLLIHSVAWNQSMAELDPQNIHSASTSWTSNVTTSGFTGCVRLTFHSNMMAADKPRPVLNYLAFQENVHFRTDGVMYGGVLPLRDFTTGSVCTNLSVEVGVYCFLRRVCVCLVE